MKSDHTLTSVKPYLIRAFYEWMIYNELTPYLDVNTKIIGTDVPQDYVKNDRITLNLAPCAVKDLHLSNDGINFYARFSGVARRVSVPIRGILSIYAKENGHGTVFNPQEDDELPVPSPKATQSKPVLRVIK